MNPEPENFDQLRRLLVLKRHEKPPPGYFDGFSAKVIARIGSDPQAAEASWWEKVAEALTLRPAASLAFGIVLCGLMAVGLLRTWREQPPSAGVSPFGDAPAATLGSGPASAFATAGSHYAPGIIPAVADSAALASNAPPDFVFDENGFFGRRPPQLQPVDFGVRTN